MGMYFVWITRRYLFNAYLNSVSTNCSSNQIEHLYNTATAGISQLVVKNSIAKYLIFEYD